MTRSPLPSLLIPPHFYLTIASLPVFHPPSLDLHPSCFYLHFFYPPIFRTPIITSAHVSYLLTYPLPSFSAGFIKLILSFREAFHETCVSCFLPNVSPLHGPRLPLSGETIAMSLHRSSTHCGCRFRDPPKQGRHISKTKKSQRRMNLCPSTACKSIIF